MKTEIDQLADRHLRPDPLGVLVEGAVTRHGVVRVSVSVAMAESSAGQHLAWMLVNLLCRQFKVVREILLDIPTVPLMPRVAPFGQRSTLGETLLECVHLVAGNHISAQLNAALDVVDISLGIGDVATTGAEHWNLYADGWRYYIGRGHVPSPTAPVSKMAIGPYLCAAAAAGEVFKVLRGMKPGKGELIESGFVSAWTLSNGTSWTDLEDGPRPEELAPLPHIYFAGAGAVAQAAAVCLAASGIRGRSSVVDRDALDLSNDNRYVLSNLRHDGADKATLLATYLKANDFSAVPVSLWWEEFAVTGGHRALDSETAELERQYLFPVVLSCVDKNPPRHSIQNAVPGLIIGGSTDGLTAKASIVDLGLKTACLKCHNPLKSRNEIVRQRADMLRVMTPEQREAYCSTHDLDANTVEKVVGPSGCGKLSEGDLTRFAADSPEMSVGFVSAAAGVLTVVQLLRIFITGRASALEPGSMAVATYARAGLRTLRIGQDQSCDCHPSLTQRWNKLWADSPADLLLDSKGN